MKNVKNINDYSGLLDIQLDIDLFLSEVCLLFSSGKDRSHELHQQLEK